MNITVTSEKVIVNGREGYIATATNGVAYTRTHRQDTAETAESVAVRLFKDGVIDGYVYSENIHSENAGDGSADRWGVSVVPNTAMENFWDGVLRTFLFTFFGGIVLFILFSCFVLSVF